MYYALFQAAIAALLQADIRPRGEWGHGFVQGQFAGLLVYRRKVYPAEFRGTLSNALDLRIKADDLLRRSVEGTFRRFYYSLLFYSD